MKKLFAALLVILLALNSFAFADYDQPILFRGIEWGITLNQLKEQMELASNSTSLPAKSVEYSLGIGQDLPVIGGEGFSINATAHPKVAGYQVSNIRFQFALMPNEDGTLEKSEYGMYVTNGDRCFLFYAEYAFYFEKPAQVYEDLLNKLTEVYGEPDMTKDIPVWYGADETLVTIDQNRDGLGRNIHIRYGCLKGNEWLKITQEIIDYDFAHDYDGL